MPALPTRVHALVDLLLAVVLLAAPWWGGFAGANVETALAIILALAVVGYTLATDHELGRVKRLQMTVHLWLDALVGLILATSPWVFSFDQRVWVPHLVIGLLLASLAVLSQTIPGYERRGTARMGLD